MPLNAVNLTEVNPQIAQMTQIRNLESGASRSKSNEFDSIPLPNNDWEYRPVDALRHGVFAFISFGLPESVAFTGHSKKAKRKGAKTQRVERAAILR